MIVLIPKPEPSARTIHFFRKLTFESELIAAIHEAAHHGTPLIRYPAFQGDWEQTRKTLVQLACEYNSPSCPFDLWEYLDGQKELLSPENFKRLLLQWRAIEIEQGRLTQLECGYIDEPDQYEPDDEDWTQPLIDSAAPE